LPTAKFKFVNKIQKLLHGQIEYWSLSISSLL